MVAWSLWAGALDTKTINHSRSSFWTISLRRGLRMFLNSSRSYTEKKNYIWWKKKIPTTRDNNEVASLQGVEVRETVNLTSQVTRTRVAYGSRNQNNDCSWGNRLRNLASVVSINSAGNSSTSTGLRVLLFRKAFLNGNFPSKSFLMVGHRSLTSSTITRKISAYKTNNNNYEEIQQLKKHLLFACLNIRNQ